jgi:hypothetical protein
MPLTFDTTVHPQIPQLSLGNVKAVLARVTPDATYPAGGELFEAGDVGLTEIFAIFVNPSTKLGATTNMFVTAERTDANSWRLSAWESGASGDALIESNLADWSAMRIDLLILGV